MRLRAFLTVPLLVLGLGISGVAHAAAPVFDNGSQLDQANVYKGAQSIGDVYASHAVYGKLEGALPFDVYSFTPDKDGDQTITLLGKKEATGADPGLIFVDPTSDTAASSQLSNFPLPDSTSHPVVVKAADAGSTYKEAALLQDYTLVAQDSFHLQKGKKYYLFVASSDPYHPAIRYAIKLGNGQAWGASDVFRHFSSWIRLQTDAYAGTSPFHVTAATIGFALMLLGLIILGGIFILFESFFFLANRAKAAAYLLVKMQPYYRVITWIGLWFAAVGAYSYFGHTSWLGTPFVASIFFVIYLIVQLVATFRLSPRIAALEVVKREATIPKELARPVMVVSVLSILSIFPTLFLLAMYLTNR